MLFLLDWVVLPRKINKRLLHIMVFPVGMYRCESWTIKKTECWRIDIFEMWCWRRFFRVPWTERRSNKSILKEISPEYSLQGLMLKFQYFGHLIRRANSSEQRLMLGKIEGNRSWYHQLSGHEFEQTPEDSEGQGSLDTAVHEVAKSWTQLSH